MKLWITKYALTKGVRVVEGKVDKNVATVLNGNGWGNHYYHGEDWHTNSGDAEMRVGKMIDAKRKALKKQLAKLDAIEDAGMIVK